MPLDRFVLIVVIVIAAAGATVWLGVTIAAAIEAPLVGWAAIVPAALVGYVIWRVIAERLRNREDDHYDNIEK
jgi:hypothetical protein